MKRRMTLLLFVVGVAGMSLVSPCGAGDVAQEALAAAGCPKCTCACSPWVGAWLGGFVPAVDLTTDGCSECEKRVIETFKLAPIALTRDTFALNLQISLCEPKVRKAFPEATDVTEFVGVACKDCQAQASGKAFFKHVDNKDELSFAVTVKNISDVTKVVLLVCERIGEPEQEVVILCPLEGGTECRAGEFSGLLCCGTILEKHCKGPLAGKKIADLIRAIEEGRASVVIVTKQNPPGELCGKVQDP